MFYTGDGDESLMALRICVGPLLLFETFDFLLTPDVGLLTDPLLDIALIDL